ncbi:trypsin-like serine peptidase [Streptomyces syringium]|uniref:trypsin-like serine peptidase n=1 Tax=Streptomyces syringium TaxID=76729 RepID=UPI003AAB6EE0
MRRPHHFGAGILLAVGALLTTGTQAATAAVQAQVQATPTTVRTLAATTTAQQQARDFWTPERMRAAAPLDIVGPRDPLSPGAAPGVPQRAGKTSTVAPTAPAERPGTVNGFPQGGGPWSGGGAVLTTSGRVFFTHQGRTASCSGNAVTSHNMSTVLTAGHCVKLKGSWHTNWVFVPGYHDGQTPHGTWAAAKTLATGLWVASESINYDVGAAVVAPLNGRKLGEVVGGQGLKFNGGYNRPMYAFGFPAAAPYDGKQLIHCSGNTAKDFLFTTDHAMTCDMTGGSSGGPWFDSFSETTGTGLQASVNSFGYTFLPNKMYGPYFGDEVKSLYEQAQTA